MVDATGTLIAGNWIGTNALGTATVANGRDGIYLDPSLSTVIGAGRSFRGMATSLWSTSSRKHVMR